MRTNRVKQKLRRGQPTVGTMLTIGNSETTRLLANSGFDWLAVDHSRLDYRVAAENYMTVAASGAIPLAYFPRANAHAIQQALSIGAFGIIAHVHSLDEAHELLAASKFPPKGNRDILSGGANLNFECTVEEYFQSVNDQILVVFVLESPSAIRSAGEICTLNGCDAIIIRPAALKIALRDEKDEYPTPQQIEQIVSEMISVTRDKGKPCGVHVTSLAQAQQRIVQGLQFLAVSSDLGILGFSINALADGLGLTPKGDVNWY
ncbi:MAG: hypothetical protein KDB03_22530 [Planctomycetales bacterium]|nr:hypothetical protein [Planctomycetales bacterium]